MEGLALELLSRQKNTWRNLSESYSALDNVSVRDLHCDGYSIKLQLNHGRILSSAANLDLKFIEKRSCFLCVEHLPEEQSAILYGNEFLILCNPAPIFPQHYTIASVRHEPQFIEGSLAAMFALAKDFGARFHVIYNGPCCGASAPDHLHFQAFLAGELPIENDIRDERKRILVKSHKGVFLYKMEGVGRAVLLLEGNDWRQVEAYLSRIINAIKRSLNVSDEPMMNLLCTFHEDIWHVMLFPRRKHRPDVYFRTDAEKMLISPGAIDMAGLVITPLEKNFTRLDVSLIKEIFREVSSDEGMVAGIIEGL